MLVRRASVMCVGMERLRLRIISTNSARSRFCRRGFAAISCADGRVAAALVLVRRIDLERRVQPQHAVEQTVVQRLGIAGRQVGAAGAADEQRVAGEEPILDAQAHRVPRVPGRVQHLNAQLPEHDGLAVPYPQVDERRGARVMHRARHARDDARAARRGEVIGVGVRIDHVADAKPWCAASAR